MIVTANGVGIGSQTVTGGAAGTLTPLTSLSINYGATAGASGVSNLTASIADPLGSACTPVLTITKTTTAATLTNTAGGTTIPYVVTITNTGLGTADGVDLLDTLPASVTYNGGATATLAGNATGSTPPGNSGSTTVPVLGTYSLPASASVTLSFNGTVASTFAGTVSNIGTARFLNPARTTATAKTTVNSAAAVTAVSAAPALTGFVYLDIDHDATMNNSDTGIGVSGLFVKLGTWTGTTCSLPALFYATVDPTTGAYSFGAVLPGTYCLVIANNNALLSATPTVPTGMVPTETPTGVRVVTVSSATVPSQNFGFYNGSSLSGRVFTDNGAGSGTANDGVVNGTEAGIAGASVAVMSGTTTLSTATTDATGSYTAWIPSSASGSLAIVETLPAGTLAVSGTAGTTAGAYTRATNATAFTFASAQTYTGVNFGNVPVNVFTPNNAQAAGPGATVPYAHSYVAGSAGQLTFTTSATSTPTAAWTQTIILDANCNGVVDAGEFAITGAITVTAGQTVCIVVRDASPVATANGAQDVVTVIATLAYANASPVLGVALTRTDTTTVSTSILLQLAKQVRNVTQGSAFATSNTALPNDVLEYQVTATNPAIGTVNNIVVSDVTPSFTAFVSAACPGSLPTGITACAVTVQPAVGATGTMQWTFTGTLPASGSVGMTYQVRVNQ